MRTNVRTPNPVKTHEGAPAFGHMKPIQALRRSVLSCLLWEDEFYEDGKTIANRIVELAKTVSPQQLCELAHEARYQHNLRHVPLLLTSVLIDTNRGSDRVSATIPNVVRRADELCELLAVYAKYKGVAPDKLKTVMTHGLRKGLAKAFTRFDAYQLAKYNRDGAVKLRDVLFLCHAKPKDEEQKATWKQLVDGTLPAPDTWEVQLSGGVDKRETFERLIREGKLGYFALLRNLRNMVQAGCDPQLVSEAILARKNGADRILPFRYVAAARAAPQFEPFLDLALQAAITELPLLKGTTAVLVDVSGSMDVPLSSKSDLKRIDAAAALASVIPGSVRMFSFSNAVTEVPPRRGMAGVDAILRSQPHGGTQLIDAVHAVNQNVVYDRLIVITDEQAHPSAFYGGLPNPKAKGYMINVASAKHGVGYGAWTHIDGFSESVLRYIHEVEAQDDASAAQ